MKTTNVGRRGECVGPESLDQTVLLLVYIIYIIGHLKGLKTVNLTDQGSFLLKTTHSDIL